MKSTNITCVLGYTPLVYSIRKIIYKHWSIVDDIPGCSTHPIIWYKETRTLRQDLVRADMTAKTESVVGHYRCGCCATCSLAKQTKEFTPRGWYTPIKMNQYSSCNTWFCVYVVCIMSEVQRTQ